MPMPMPHEHIPGHTPHPSGHGHKPESKADTKAAGEAAITEGLQAIYGDDRSDLHVVARDGSRLTRLLTRIVLALALLSALAFAGVYVYTNYFSTHTASRPLVMSIEAPAEVKSGEQARIVVHYSNPGRVPLAALELDVNLPPAFVLSAAQPEPTDAEQLVWNIGSLGSHSDGQLILDGVWLSGVPATTNIQTLAAYRPGNFNSDFSDIATATVTTLSSTLTLDLKGPEASTPGQELEYTATITNTGTETMKAGQFTLTLPSGFLLSSSQPALEAGADPNWLLADLLPQATTTITWKGAFTADVSDVQQFGAVVSLPEDDRQLPQVTAQWFTDVAGSDLHPTLVVNGNTDQATTELGGTMRLSLRLENVGQTDLTDASFVLDFKPDSGVPIVWASSALSGGKLTAAGISFDAATVGTIKAGDKQTYNLSFPIKTVLGPNDVDAWTVTAYVTSGDAHLQTPPFPISMKASAKLSAAARFYSESGAPIGTGPLPPKVAETTSYRIFWNIDKAVHELDDMTVTATLPPDVTWNDSVLNSTGNVSYDEATRTVRWDISSLPADVEASAEFTVQVKPGEEDVGTFVKMLSGSVLAATDATTNTAVETQAESLTTEVPEDTYAAGKGTVVE